MLRQPSQSSSISSVSGEILRLIRTVNGTLGFWEVTRVLGDFEHRNLLRFVNLIGRQSYAIIFLHGFDHVIDELFENSAIGSLGALVAPQSCAAQDCRGVQLSGSPWLFIAQGR